MTCGASGGRPRIGGRHEAACRHHGGGDRHSSSDRAPSPWDVVRLVTRWVGRLAKALECPRIKGFRDRTRAARRRMQEIQRMTTQAAP